jgi:hypothetical protein
MKSLCNIEAMSQSDLPPFIASIYSAIIFFNVNF